MQITIPEWVIQWIVFITIGAGLTLATAVVAYALLLWSFRAAKKVTAVYEIYVIQWWLQKLQARGWVIPTKKRLDTLEKDRGDLIDN